MKLPLERGTIGPTPKKVPWASSLPFVENSRGVLIHRPRSGMSFYIHRSPHIGIGFWCGMHTASDGKNLTFHDAPPDGKILCERCEAAAVAAGLPSADELAGRHVHKGCTKPVITCCAARVKEEK